MERVAENPQGESSTCRSTVWKLQISHPPLRSATLSSSTTSFKLKSRAARERLHGSFFFYNLQSLHYSCIQHTFRALRPLRDINVIPIRLFAAQRVYMSYWFPYIFYQVRILCNERDCRSEETSMSCFSFFYSLCLKLFFYDSNREVYARGMYWRDFYRYFFSRRHKRAFLFTRQLMTL